MGSQHRPLHFHTTPHTRSDATFVKYKKRCLLTSQEQVRSKFAHFSAAVVNFSYLHGVGGHLGFRLWIKSYGEREEGSGGRSSENKPRFKVSLSGGSKTGFTSTTASLVADTRGFPCRLHASLTRPHSPGGVLEGGLAVINYIFFLKKEKEKLRHKSVPVQLEKEAVVPVEVSAQRSCRHTAAPAARCWDS